MRNNGYQNYFQDEVLEASPMRLIELLYRGALDAISSAKRSLRSGDIRARSRAITKALAIVAELSRALDMERGGELSRNLAELYDYVGKLLIKANSQQSEPPLNESERLLSTLLDAWTAMAARERNSAADGAATPVTENYQPISCAC